MIEKWCLALPANPNPANTPVPTKVHEIIVIENPTAPPLPHSYTITGAPLIVEFNKMFLRQPIPPEHNIVLTQANLWDLVESVWH